MHQVLKSEILLQIQSIKQSNSALREALDTGVEEFRPPEVIIFQFFIFIARLVKSKERFFFFLAPLSL